MASAARYPNLPGFEFITQDGNLIPVKNRPLTDSLLIIGPALDGPTDRIVLVNTLPDVEFLYGKITFNSSYIGPNGETQGYSGNGLIKALREASAGGAADIRLLRVGGTKASGQLTVAGTGVVSGTLNATGIYGGRIYNQVSLTFTSGAVSGQVVITQPVVKGPAITFSFVGITSGTTIQQMIDLVNSYPKNQSVRLSLPTTGAMNALTPVLNLAGTLQLAGGTDGTIMDDLKSDKSLYYEALVSGENGNPALFSDFLADYEVDVIYLADLYADDVVVANTFTQSVAQDFANYLARRSVDYPMLGVIGCRPLQDFSTRAAIQAHHDALVNTNSGMRGQAADNYMNFGYFMNNGFLYSDGTLEQPIDAGGYLQVVAADVLINDQNIGLYQETAAAIYAGTICKLSPQQPATYKPVMGTFGLPYQFTRAQLDDMNGGIGANSALGLLGGGAYVTVRQIVNHGTLFVRDVTAAFRTSDFKDLQPLRIANAVHRGIRDICFPYLGLANSVPNRAAMESQVKSFLDQMADAGALLGRDGIGYTVQIKADSPLKRVLGIIDIEITLRPALQIKTIRVKVALSL